MAAARREVTAARSSSHTRLAAWVLLVAFAASISASIGRAAAVNPRSTAQGAAAGMQEGGREEDVRIRLMSPGSIDGGKHGGDAKFDARFSVRPTCKGHCQEGTGSAALMQLSYSGQEGVPPSKKYTEKQSSGPKTIPQQAPFNARCQCGAVVTVAETGLVPMENPYGKCAAKSIRVELERAGDVGFMSKDDVRKAIGVPVRIKWAKAINHHFSDVSGRAETPILGLPGGDLGEFINALDAYEELTSTVMNQQQVINIFNKYLSYTQKVTFYMSTDSASLMQVENNLNVENLDLTEPPAAALRNLLLSALVLPESIGCKALRHLMMNTRMYNIDSPILPSYVIRAFFEILWDRHNANSRILRLVEQEGEDSERAMIKVKTSESCGLLGIFPLIQPKGSNVCDSTGCGKSFFVSHQTAAQPFREEMANFFGELDSRVKIKPFLEILNANGKIYERNAIETLCTTGGRKLPVFVVEIA